MKIRIENKKVFAEFVAAVIILVGILSFFTYKLIRFEKGSGAATAQNQEGTGSRSFFGAKSPTKTGSGNGDTDSGKATARKEYDNQTYRYKITYPDSWHINKEFSEAKQEAGDADNTRQVTSGGQTFWSNYKNIDDFSPQQKPADFHLLGLTVYESPGLDSDGIAALLGFDAASTLKTQAFPAKGISGKEYVAAGADDKNPSVAVIFRKDKRFFVFNLGFINGDAQAAEAMEKIIETFTLL